MLTIALSASVHAGDAASGGKYAFDGKISREVLELYLSRAITQLGLTHSPQRAEDIRMLKNVGAKFIGRAACMWRTSENPDEAAYFRKCHETADLIHKTDPDVILEACIFEAVYPGVNKIPVPAWVFEAVGLAPEQRAFKYDAMLYDRGKPAARLRRE